MTVKKKVIIGVSLTAILFIFILLILFLNNKNITENDANSPQKLFSDNSTTEHTEDPIFATTSSITVETESSSIISTTMKIRETTSTVGKTSIQKYFINGGPSIFPRSPFNSEVIEASVQKIYGIISLNRSNHLAINNELISFTSNQRVKIHTRYAEKYKTDLKKTFSLGGVKLYTDKYDVAYLNRLLMMEPLEIEVEALNEAIRFGRMDRFFSGILEDVIVDIICLKSNAELKALSTRFKRDVARRLDVYVKDEIKSDFGLIITRLLAANRSEAVSDMQKAKETAKKLYNAGQGMKGTNEEVFYKIMIEESLEQLKQIFEIYKSTYKIDFKEIIEDEFAKLWERDQKRVLLAIYDYATKPSRYWARRLYETLQGLGTDEFSLSRIIVLRAEIDIKEIVDEFYLLYNDTLRHYIINDTSELGMYQKVLLKMCGLPSFTPNYLSNRV